MRSLACYNCNEEGSEHPYCSVWDNGNCPNEEQVEFYDNELEFEKKDLEYFFGNDEENP